MPEAQKETPALSSKQREALPVLVVSLPNQAASIFPCGLVLGVLIISSAELKSFVGFLAMSLTQNVSCPAPPIMVLGAPRIPPSTSSPLPPSRLSLPAPPHSVSLPSPPTSVSLPWRPKIRSLPPPPARLSSPAPPTITSSSSPPVITSWPPRPSICVLIANADVV